MHYFMNLKHLKLGFLASHNGSNVEAILKNIENGSLDAEPKVIITNNPDAGVLKIAKEHSIKHYCLNQNTFSKEFSSLDNALLQTLKNHGVNLVILAGYMKPISKAVLDAYPNRILNIHPALLPKYGGKGMYGKNVHEAVIKSKDKESGATVHIVNDEYDSGRVLAQCKVPLYPSDTPETLSARVLRFEHVLYPQVLRDIKEGLIDLDNP